MKKLMTMLAAVATAFGLYAADDVGKIAATTFEADGEFQGGALVTGGQTGWTAPQGDATLVQAAANTYTKYTEAKGLNPRYMEFTEADTASLSIKTTLGDPLLRAAAATPTVLAPVYFDQLVKFTAFDEEPTTIGANDKIALFVRDMTEDATAPAAETNLYAMAGQWTDSTLTSGVIYDLGKIDDLDAWHRVTIKALPVDASGLIGFQVYVDGAVRTADKTGFNGTAVSSLTDAGRTLNQLKYLIPANAKNVQSLASVGFDGQGWLDDLSVTTTSPFPAARTVELAIKLGTHATGFKYKVNNGTVVDATADVNLVYTPGSGMKIQVLPTTFDPNWAFDEIKGMSRVALSEGWWELTPTENDTTATIYAKDATPRIKIGDNYYPNFKKACAAIGTPAAGQTVTVELQDAVDVGWDDEEGTDATFNAGEGEIIIDLKGKTITGKAEDAETGYVLKCSGAVTIQDTVGGGKIVIGSDAVYAGVVKQASGCLTVTGGTFEGKVDVSAAAASIAGGKFAKASNTADNTFSLVDKIAPGFKLGATAGDYWEVVAKEKYTIKVEGAANAVVTINEEEVTELELTEGEDYEIVVTPNANYEYKEDGTYDPFIRANDGTLTKSGTANASVTLTAADATAIEWTITYYDDSDPEPQVFNTDTYTIENHGTKELNAGKRDGYTFLGWKDENGKSVTSLADKTGDLDLYGEWEKEEDPYPPYVGDDPKLQGEWAAWSQGKSIDDPEAPAVKEAFLLNCDLAALETEKAAFKCTSITIDATTGEVTVTTPDKQYNGYLYIEGKETLEATSWNFPKQATDKFFQAILTTENRVNVD